MEVEANAESDGSDASVYEEYGAVKTRDTSQQLETSTSGSERNDSVKSKKGMKGKLKMLYKSKSDEPDKTDSGKGLSMEIKSAGIITSLGNKFKLKLKTRNSLSRKGMKVNMESPVCDSSDSDDDEICDTSEEVNGEMLVYEDLVPTDQPIQEYTQLKLADSKELLQRTEPCHDEAPPIPARSTHKGTSETRGFSDVPPPRPTFPPTKLSTLGPTLGASISTEIPSPVSTENRYKSVLESDALYQIYDEEKVSRARDKEAIYSDFDDSDEDFYTDDTEDIYEDISVGRTAQKPESERIAETNETIISCSNVTHVPVRKETVLKSLWSETDEVKSSGILEHMSPHEIKLQESLFEIITSEATFHKSLNILVDVFMTSEEFSPTRKPKAALSKRDHHVIFSNVDAIRKSSERFLSDLESLWKKSVNLHKICEIICEHASSQNFDCYVHYCRNQEFQERTVSELRKQTDFVEALKRLESNPVCQKLSLSSFLLLPMQRITRLPLLIDAVRNRMNPDTEKDHYDVAVKACRAINKVVKQCNESARKIQQTEQMVQIAKNIAFSTTKEITKVPLISSSRHLIKQGDLVRLTSAQSGILTVSKAMKMSKQPLRVFVFNDLIVLTKKKGNDRYSVVDYGQRNLLHTEILDEPEQLNKFVPTGIPTGCKFLFVLVILENHEKKHVESIFSCNSLSDRERWVSAITPGNSSDDQTIYEEWDCPQVQCIRKFTAQEADELTLEEADVVNVFKKLDDGMYEGERLRDGARGWFPKDFTREIENAHVRARNLRMQYRLKTAAAEGDSSC